jgi:hypothetical protein
MEISDGRELKLSCHKHKFGFRLVEREKVRRHPVGNAREKGWPPRQGRREPERAPGQ